MSKLFVIVFLASIFVAVQCNTPLNCYFCLNECEASKASEKKCGESIGTSHEAVCVTRVGKESKTPSLKQRRCEIIQKGNKVSCEGNQACTQCNTNLCNSASSISSHAAIVALVFTFFGARYLMQ